MRLVCVLAPLLDRLFVPSSAFLSAGNVCCQWLL